LSIKISTCLGSHGHIIPATMVVARLKSILCTLIVLWCTRCVAARGYRGNQNRLRDTKTNRSGFVDYGFSRAGESKGRGGIVEGPGFFLLNDKNWTSEEQFVLGGGRCQTKRPSDAQRAQHATDLRNFRSSAENKNQRQRRLKVKITVFVNWVVISHSNGAGALTQEQMDSQVNVLNAAFAPHFRFQILNIQRVVNNDLFTCTDANELVISQTYRTGDSAVLNFFTCYPPGYLGWSRFPYGGNAGSVWDFVIVAYNTVPGGNLGPYSYGHVSMVAQNHGNYKPHFHMVSLFPQSLFR
jgi:hypothetical protein